MNSKEKEIGLNRLNGKLKSFKAMRLYGWIFFAVIFLAVLVMSLICIMMLTQYIIQNPELFNHATWGQVVQTLVSAFPWAVPLLSVSGVLSLLGDGALVIAIIGTVYVPSTQRKIDELSLIDIVD